MADLHEADLGTAFYRSRDPIKNLKIKVCLRRVTSVNIKPQAELEEELGRQDASNLNLAQAMHDRNFGEDQTGEEVTVKWQEKLFSQREVDLYSDASNCITVLDKKYAEDVVKLRAEYEDGRPNKRIFSYVDQDNFTNADENTKKFTTDPNEKRTLVAEKMSTMRYRRNVTHKRNDLAVIPKTNLIDYEPSEERKKLNHYIHGAMQTMYIMVDCSPKGVIPSADDEVVICTIKVDANGVLSVKPDFTRGGGAYKVESQGTRGREMFEYTLENCSVQLTWQEQERENKMFRELYGRHQEFLAACVGHEFEMPEKDVLRLLIYGEIEAAWGFEYDDLYVTYMMEVPDGWRPLGTQKLLDMTPTCRTKRVKRDNVAYYSFPFSLELLYHSSSILKKTDEMPRWPQIHFEVASLDSWNRHRVEGYGCLAVPHTPGASEHVVSCWRPVGQSLASELRRFFIGGSPELEDATFVGTPSTFHGTHLSKYGFRTVSTGNVAVKIRTMQQSQSFLETQASKKKVGQIMDRIGFSVTQANIIGAIEAFQRAKKKMIAARENLKKDFIETLKAREDSDD